MPAIYGMIGEADPKKAPRFRLKVNGRWIDIQLAEALLIHEILESWIQPATEAIKMGLNTAESPSVAVRDLVARKHKNVLEVDFDGGIPTPPPPRILQ